MRPNSNFSRWNVKLILFIAFAALKIHCSTECKQLLDRLGGYIVEERGKIAIKGKGDQFTYWLIGETTTGSRNRAHQRRQAQLIATVDHTGEKRRLKSSLRNRTSTSPARPFGTRGQLLENQLASSLDSPKRLRFANSSDEDRNNVVVDVEEHRHRHHHQPPEPLTAPSSFDMVDEIASNSKRNSCPNLKVLSNNCSIGSGGGGGGGGGGAIDRSSCSADCENRPRPPPPQGYHKKYRMSSMTSLGEASADAFPTITETTAATTSINSSPLLLSRKHHPKIELSSPEETERLSLINDCRWPLLRDSEHNGPNGSSSNGREKANGDRETVV